MIISERRSRETGTMIQVIDNRDGQFDTDDLPWITLCTDHGNYCSHETRKLATRFGPFPSNWCAACQE